ncbi:hypothetical protein NOU13_31525 [Rhodococcus erythropolis]|uniref:hypothetical protein n=1 Tax=Rhodococcus erythropolis TaxID=1833 RepID=UPI00210BA88A|nr:hypothetical protein [Rhodococcus erythropolis]MCQ4129037.1 hypothetical protein [Rhodococcus erythropolis]
MIERACRIKTGFAALVNSRRTFRGGFFWAETNYVTGSVAGLSRYGRIWLIVSTTGL